MIQWKFSEFVGKKLINELKSPQNSLVNAPDIQWWPVISIQSKKWKDHDVIQRAVRIRRAFDCSTTIVTLCPVLAATQSTNWKLMQCLMIHGKWSTNGHFALQSWFQRRKKLNEFSFLHLDRCWVRDLMIWIQPLDNLAAGHGNLCRAVFVRPAAAVSAAAVEVTVSEVAVCAAIAAAAQTPIFNVVQAIAKVPVEEPIQIAPRHVLIIAEIQLTLHEPYKRPPPQQQRPISSSTVLSAWIIKFKSKSNACSRMWPTTKRHAALPYACWARCHCTAKWPVCLSYRNRYGNCTSLALAIMWVDHC